MADEIEQIRSRVSIVDLVSQRVSLRRTGKTFQGLCPFHDDRKPSFTVSPDIGRYRCWSCGATGDIFNWVMETQRVDFGEALRILAEQAGVTLTRGGPKVEPGVRARQESIMAAAQAFFADELKKSEEASSYCQSRGLDQQVIRKWGLGYGPPMGEALAAFLLKNRISLAEAEELFLVQGSQAEGYRDRFRSRLTIPIRDEKGKVIAYGGRIIGDGIPKYINSGDTPLFHKSHVLYGLDLAKEPIRKSDRAVLVEGYMDVIACHRAGVEQAVASLGTSLTEDQVKILKRWCQTVVILYDRDEAGQKAAEKATDLLLEAGLRVRIALPPPGEDPDSLLTKEGGQAVVKIVEEAVTPVFHRVRRLREKMSPREEGFWDEAAFALSYASSLLEVEEHLAPLAAEYPNAPDRTAAMEALRRMAISAKKKRKKGGQSSKGESVPAPPALPVLPPAQQGLEGRVLRALFDPGTRQSAWKACTEPGLFRPGIADEAARAVAAAFPSGAPQGPPSLWLAQIAEPARTLLGDLFERPLPRMARAEAVEEMDRVSLEELEAAVARLREHRRRRELNPTDLALQGDDAIRARLEELRRSKGAGTS